jgi:hypothetical protein
MDLSILDQVAQLQQQCRLMQQTVGTLQTQVEQLVTSLLEQAKAEGKPLAFTDLEGIWHGTDLSLEDIKAAEYHLPENLL